MHKIVLSAASMGDVNEVDFDLWAAFVADKIDDLTGLTVEVDQFAFTGRGAESEDRYEMGAEEREMVREAVRSLWEAFCGEEWEARREAHDAKPTASY